MKNEHDNVMPEKVVLKQLDKVLIKELDIILL